jgi:hypothetical protein
LVALSGTSDASPKIARAIASAFLAGGKPKDINKTSTYGDMLNKQLGFKKIKTATKPAKTGRIRLGKYAGISV